MLLFYRMFLARIDAIFVPVLVWRIKPGLFRRAKWVQAIMAGVIWYEIWHWAISNFWHAVYIDVFPSWGQGWIQTLFGLLRAIAALGLWALALRIRLHPVWEYALLGSLMGVCTHIWAVYRGIPLLQGASPIAAVVITFFEYLLYWCIILSLSAILRWLWTTLRIKMGRNFRPLDESWR